MLYVVTHIVDINIAGAGYKVGHIDCPTLDEMSPEKDETPNIKQSPKCINSYTGEAQLCN